MASRTSAALEIRKLRKKLRQIEHLERREGDLLDEELLKISKKTAIRENLLRLLATTEDIQESFEESTQSNVTNNSNASTDYQDPDMSTNVTVVTPEEEDSYVDVETLNGEINEENFTADPNKQTPSVEEIIGTNDVSPQETQSHLTPEREAQIERNNPFHVTKRKSISNENESESSNQHKEKTKPVKATKARNQADVSSWRNCVFYVTELEGHSDLIMSSDILGTTLVTASRDTTVKVWNLEEMREERSLGGHTGAVNTVVILPTQSSNKICESAGFSPIQGNVILSGSTDCSFKLWCSATGKILRSTYTFSPVTQVAYHGDADVFITGSDGGKLEIWNVQSGKSVQGLHAFQDSVSGIQIQESKVFAASLDGVIKVFEMQDKQLHCVFTSDDIRAADGSSLCHRGIRGMMVSEGIVYYGDDGANLKALTWSSGIVHKLGNHNEEFGITDSLTCCKGLLLASAFCLDTGLGYINVRSSEEEKYLCSLDDGETDRIMSVCCSTQAEDLLLIVSTGVQLKVWSKTLNTRYIHPDARRVKPTYYPRLTKAPRHSDVESDLESSESGSDDPIEDEPSAPSQSWRFGCTVV